MKKHRCQQAILALVLSLILTLTTVSGIIPLHINRDSSVYGLSSAGAYHFYAKSGNSIDLLAESVTAAAVNKTDPAQGDRMVGYYAAWASYSGFTPDLIDASKLTHINYAFAKIDENCRIALGYPTLDPVNFGLLNALKKKNSGLKTLISVGGWAWSGRFSDAAFTDASRTAFADSCVAFIKTYGFDGVDIDWEYPTGGGLPENGKRPADRHNFTLLLEKLREKLDEQGAEDHSHYLLTIAGGAGSSYPKGIELSEIHKYLDYATIMTYDIHGIWDNYTDLFAPLYNSTDPSPQYKTSVDSSIAIWKKSGFPMDKLVMGIPFYGYLYSSATSGDQGLYSTFSDARAIDYVQIEENYLYKNGYTRYFHDQSQVPWLYNGSIFISYEDPESIGIKTGYIKSNHLGGAMIWELSQDPDRILLNAVYDGLKK